MIAVNDISITLSTEDSKSKAILDFSPICSISSGDSISLTIKDFTLDLSVESNTSLSAWLDWIIANYNILSTVNATLSKSGSNLVILGDNTDDLGISLDLGSS